MKCLLSIFFFIYTGKEFWS